MPDITIPMPSGTGKSWAKHVSGIGDEPDGRALQGDFLTRGSTYSITPGELVITVDEAKVEGKEVRLVTLYQVADDTWETVKVWTLRGKIGLAILKFLGRRLPESPRKPTLVEAAPERTSPNAKGGKCAACGRRVEPGDGIWREVARTVQHNQCPPERPKSYRGWDVVHDECLPNPHNKTAVSTWRVARPAEGWGFGAYVPGTAERVTVPSHAGVDIPADAPGWRQLRNGGTSVVAVVTTASKYRQYDEDGNSEFPGHDGIVFEARVRVATPEEAADVLAEEATRRRRAELTTTAQRLLGGALPPPADAEFPSGRRMPTDATSVRIDGEYRSWGSRYYATDDEVWTVRDDGYDEGSTTLVMPVTAERRELIAELRAEFGGGGL